MLSAVNFVWIVLGLVESLPKEKSKTKAPARRLTPIDIKSTGTRRLLSATPRSARAVLCERLPF